MHWREVISTIITARLALKGRCLPTEISRTDWSRERNKNIVQFLRGSRDHRAMSTGRHTSSSVCHYTLLKYFRPIQHIKFYRTLLACICCNFKKESVFILSTIPDEWLNLLLIFMCRIPVKIAINSPVGTQQRKRNINAKSSSAVVRILICGFSYTGLGRTWRSQDLLCNWSVLPVHELAMGM